MTTWSQCHTVYVEASLIWQRWRKLCFIFKHDLQGSYHNYEIIEVYRNCHRFDLSNNCWNLSIFAAFKHPFQANDAFRTGARISALKTHYNCVCGNSCPFNCLSDTYVKCNEHASLCPYLPVAKHLTTCNIRTPGNSDGNKKCLAFGL